MALSRVAKNNIIIIVVTLFILLINFTNDRLYTREDETSEQANAVLGQPATILTLSIENQIDIMRKGIQWQATPELLNEQFLEQMMYSWQSAQGQVVNAPPSYDPQMALVVTVITAEQPVAQILHVYTLANELLLHHQQSQRWYSMPLAMFSQLIPNEVLAN